jgi:hypothetical protein
MTDRIPHSEMADEMDKLIYSKTDWLSRFSQGQDKRPDHEIEVKRRELAVLRQAAADYRAAAGRRAA